MKMKTTKRGKKIIEPNDKGITFAKSLTMKRKILIADDDPGIRDIFNIILVKAGYDIEIKDDANEIFKNKFKIPDLFIVDRLLSGVDGLDVCRYLKSNEQTKNIPVVMVSASPDIGILAVKAGADDFVEKPFDLKSLLNVIERNINRAKNERSLKSISNLQ
ncbi:MAG TPA: response regulator [Chitinophagaceae bacterium]|nr:response regulator [Chitinophagaceae bacterium]